MSGFRLIESSGLLDRGDISSPTAHQNFPIRFSERQGSRAETWVTVLIGKNGVGKSRLLSGLSNILSANDVYSRRALSEVSVSSVLYDIGGRNVRIERAGKKYTALVDGKVTDLREVPFPAKVIALTTTPFDKFFVPRIPTTAENGEEEGMPGQRYCYLGLRDRSGRASTTSALFRSVEAIFNVSRSTLQKRKRLAEVFSFLNYKPTLKVTYEVPYGDTARLGQITELKSYSQERGRPYFSSRTITYLSRSGLAVERLATIGHEVLDRMADSRSFSLMTDLSHEFEQIEFFNDIQHLRRADLLRVRSVEVTRLDGTVLDLRYASSGELGIVTSFLGLGSVIENNSIVFIDESEISLHPEWQASYLHLLLNVFKSYSGVHFIVATHSPLVLSDMSLKNCNVVSISEEKSTLMSSSEFAGQSSDYILANAFRVPGENNLFIKQQITSALRLVADGKSNTDKYAEIIEPLVEVIEAYESDDPVRKVIEGLASAAENGADAQN